MGDLIGQALEGKLFRVPVETFGRVARANVPATARARLFADLARINVLYMIGRAGSGHIGSSFSSLDIVTWLHLEGLKPGDVYFSSKGHDVPGFYSVLVGTGRLPEDKLDQLRRLGGLSGHPDIHTDGIPFNTGSLGMGVSKAKGLALANRLQGRASRIRVLTGDGELQEGQFWESLLSSANHGLHEITVLVDNNKFQSDRRVTETSDLGDLEAKFRAFGWHVARCDGHDLDALSSILAQFDALTDRPKAVICDTVKGRGVSFMEHTAMTDDQEFYRFHSGAPSAADYLRGVDELWDRCLAAFNELGLDVPVLVEVDPVPVAQVPADAQRLVPAYSQALIAAAARRGDLVALDADLILDTGLVPFREQYPDRFFECGIAEQDMVSQACGFAAGGLLPVMHSFACFLSTRPNEQIYNLSTEKRKVIYAASLAGLLPAGPGHSHQSVRDISAVGSVPGLVMIEPGWPEQAQQAVDFAVDINPESTYIRLCSLPFKPAFERPADAPLVLGQGTVIRDGADGVMFAYGPLFLNEAWQTVRLLEEQGGPSLSLVAMPWLNRVDGEWLASLVRNKKLVVTLDNHYTSFGQGQMLAAEIAGLGLERAPRVLRFGLDRIPACGRNDEVLKAHGLDAASLAARIRTA